MNTKEEAGNGLMGASRSSYGHRIQLIGHDHYRLSWIVDFKYPNSRLRFPRTMSRDTDEVGARRFAKKWGAQMPELKQQRGQP